MRADQEWLRDIQHNADLVASFVDATDRKTFLKDSMRSMATAKGIENIGEAVKNISQALKDRYPAVDWTGPARMRDRTTHGYWKVDYGIIWETATREIPAFRAQIAQILAAEFGSSNETASRD
jgi:uncharacterized protein with HEPN domain